MLFDHYKYLCSAFIVFAIIVSSSGGLQCEKTVKYLDRIKLCKNPDKVKVLNFDNKPISKLEEDIFLKCTGVTDLYLSDTNLSEISWNIFRGMDSLESLYLNDNQIIKLNNNSFGRISKLMQLHLNNNSISDIDEGTFDQLPKLINIYLKSNLLSKIPENIFPIHNVVYRINFDSNSLSDTGFIRNLINIVVLDLPHNKIETLESKNFVNLVNLQYVDLKHNLIKELPINLFVHQTNLIQVDLSHNRLIQIETATFNVGFRDLLLNDNNITTIGVLNNISEINLNRNHLRELATLPENSVNLFIDDNPWYCDFVYMLTQCSNINVSFTNTNSEKNIQGVPCEDKKKLPALMDTSFQGSDKVITNLRTFAILSILSSISILLLSITIYIYFKKQKENHSKQENFGKYFKKKRLSSLDNWNPSGAENGYLTPICEEHIYQEIH